MPNEANPASSAVPNIDQQSNKATPDTIALEFLPAALEIQESPPSPIGRLIIWLIVLFLVIAVTWSYFGRVDVVAVAPGKVVPSMHVKQIQPIEIGSVAAIHVTNGAQVHKGEPLITLDATQVGADRERIASELLIAQMDVSRQKGFARHLEDTNVPPELIDWPSVATPTQKIIQQQMLVEHAKAFGSNVEALSQQIHQQRAEREGVVVELQKYRKILPLSHSAPNRSIDCADKTWLQKQPI